MNILIIGAGMYVTGRDGTGTGTILSSLAEVSRVLPIGEVTVLATSIANETVVAEAAARINSVLETSLNVCYRAVPGDATVDIPAICAENRYDAAIVSVPDHLHFVYTSALMRQGIHCLVVKPLTPTLAEAQELESIRDAERVYGAVEFHKRWDATNLWIRKALDEKKLGKLLYFTVDYSQRITIPLTTFRGWSDRTNIFQYLGVHYVDLIWFLTRFIPIRVIAVGMDGTLRQQGIQTWDSVHATIIWQNPADQDDRFVSQFTTNWIDPFCSSAMSDQKYKVIGTRGRIECDQKNRGVELVHEDAGVQQINPYFSNYLPDAEGHLRFCGYGHESISQFVRDIVDLGAGRTTIATLEQSRPTLRQSLVSTSVIDSVNQSLAHGSAWKEINAPF
jgi:predicted dehydrogenase